jgi:hypothetical protein
VKVIIKIEECDEGVGSRDSNGRGGLGGEVEEPRTGGAKEPRSQGVRGGEEEPRSGGAKKWRSQGADEPRSGRADMRRTTVGVEEWRS